MRHLLVGLVLVVFGIAVPFGIAQRDAVTAQAPAANALMGVWRISEVVTADANKHNTAPQPGIIIFTRGYYSFNVVRTDVPRPELPASGATDKQLAEAFGPFDAVAGSYTEAGNQLRYERIAAKNPNAMRPGTRSTATFRFESPDTMSMTEDRPNSATWKLSRLE